MACVDLGEKQQRWVVFVHVPLSHEDRATMTMPVADALVTSDMQFNDRPPRRTLGQHTDGVVTGDVHGVGNAKSAIVRPGDDQRTAPVRIGPGEDSALVRGEVGTVEEYRLDRPRSAFRSLGDLLILIDTRQQELNEIRHQLIGCVRKKNPATGVASPSR
jgi:hypothetical protein